ncbi:MAG: DUF4278 domain-containing protein [Symploca sp. SIO1B1]|nr:DUF4278 domain-containing protein [Symploca sp. SIO1C2]NER49034.1 DUF4278 domain-containing protein [Symploca sp. SIO1A3]NER94504.1 DUF4278 domain-containing protein [Symploca sp. SIO1B1]
MKLAYRGLPYETREVTIDTSETELTARFRGQQYTIRRPVNLMRDYITSKKYRGVVYN